MSTIEITEVLSLSETATLLELLKFEENASRKA
jgi:hypothetical protein